MKLTEVFEKSGIEQDEKARRVVNTSTARAKITADEIERGVTLERLEGSLGVPVYRYATQITIHGIVPGFSDAARPAGYKSVFRNGNGTVGVRYVAIDAAKKELVVSASRYGTRGWSAHLTSEGLHVSRFFEDKLECIAAFKAFPRDIVCGSVVAGAAQLGGYVVLAYIGAIPEASVWPFIYRLWGISSSADLNAIIAAEKARWEKVAAEDKERREKLAAENHQKKQTFAASVTYRKRSGIPTGEGSFLKVGIGDGGVGLWRYTFKKRGPQLCFYVERFVPDRPSIEGKFRKLDSSTRARLQEACAEGLVFEVPVPSRS